MAAHAVTGLTEVLERAKGEDQGLFMMLQGALSLSCWTEDLDLDDWKALLDANSAQDFQGLVSAASATMPKYVKEWESLGEPTMRETWHKAKYPGL